MTPKVTLADLARRIDDLAERLAWVEAVVETSDAMVEVRVEQVTSLAQELRAIVADIGDR